ncbi:MAG: hypothetical protein GY724_19500 [Actinomycetia bacterium]|nr:hypothetical protein [Actinomycetes bacterium]MCP4226531.1 hypothetical protein [Actinomycetes bacterium]MCP5035124.1 hypothetical protein [Actinomycetes bacterium]
MNDVDSSPSTSPHSEPPVATTSTDEEAPRQLFELEDLGFNEVPKKWRRFYRYWKGPDDELGPNEIVCPVCKIVVRSKRELRPGDRLYCMPCMSRLRVVRGDDGVLTTEVVY